MDVRQKQRCVIEFLNAEEVHPIDIHKRLVNVYGGKIVDVSTIRRWVRCFQSDDRDVRDKPRSGRSSTAINEKSEARLDEPIKSNRRITVNKMSTELEVSVGAVGKLISSLGYSKRCATWVPRMLTSEQKYHHRVIVS